VQPESALLILRNLTREKFIMRSFRSSWFPFFIGILTCVFILDDVLPSASQKALLLHQEYREGEEWSAPAAFEIPTGEEGEAIRYGQELIAHTSTYLGPKGIVGNLSNGMNCQNCHTYAGTENFANPFSAVASTYPKYRERSGRTESVEFRVNDCMQRSMNGKPLDSLSREMKAMVAYLKWVGSNVPKGLRPKGSGTESLSFLERPADPQKGRQIFLTQCQRCHGAEGQGLLSADSTAYVYPPLWGDHSYNAGAGIHRLSLLAGFIKNNMPFGVNWQAPELSTEEAWDVAAFVASKPRPIKLFANDWKDVSKKPVDYPFGPYADSLPEQQHKYGPFGAMKKSKQ
jgi:thiosulfate dehydrogenase